MKKRYGIRITLPEGSTLLMDHLLGKDWEAYRWYDSAEARDVAFEDMLRQPGNYRQGDIVQQVLHKVERSE